MSTNSRIFLRLSGAIASVVPLLALQACDDNTNACKQSGSVTVCGEFGDPIYVADLSSVSPTNSTAASASLAAQVQWPPVAIENGRIVLAAGKLLLQVSAQGEVSKLVDVQKNVASPSTDAAGHLYLVAASGTGTMVAAYDDRGSGKLRWNSANLTGTPVGTPASVGSDLIYAATRDGVSSAATLYTLRQDDGTVVAARNGASPAAVLPNGTIRYLQTPMGHDGLSANGSEGAPLFGALIAEDAKGNILWQHAEPKGIVDFAPGAEGETYIVTGGSGAITSPHSLRRVDVDGSVAWSFEAPCQDCTVAAAPTVDGDTVYFPVWEKRQAQPIDPLYAISAKDGKQLWQYDGFFTKKQEFSAAKLIVGSGDQPLDVTRTQHHPAGRPVIAADRSLYVATDGAVTALDNNGQVLGYAMYDAKAGEVSDGFSAHASTWINPGVRPSPVLGPDGTLYVWDGAAVHAFRTNRGGTSAKAWIAPYGGPSNSGRAPN